MQREVGRLRGKLRSADPAEVVARLEKHLASNDFETVCILGELWPEALLVDQDELLHAITGRDECSGSRGLHTRLQQTSPWASLPDCLASNIFARIYTNPARKVQLAASNARLVCTSWCAEILIILGADRLPSKLFRFAVRALVLMCCCCIRAIAVPAACSELVIRRKPLPQQTAIDIACRWRNLFAHVERIDASVVRGHYFTCLDPMPGLTPLVKSLRTGNLNDVVPAITSGLTGLDLTPCTILQASRDLNCLMHLPNLTSLKLPKSKLGKYLDDSEARRLRDFTSRLKSFSCRGAELLTDSGLAALKLSSSLESLMLEKCRMLGPAAPSVICQLTSLTELVLGEARKLTAEGVGM